MQDNVSSHLIKLTFAYLPKVSPDIEPTENLWSIIKSDVQKNRKQYARREDLLEAVISATNRVKVKTIEKLSSIN